MNIQDVIREMREMADAEGLNEMDILRWADALEAAMREPVGEVGYMWSSPSTSQATSVIRPLAVTHARHIPPGTKLYALPPDAAGEIGRLKEEIERLNKHIRTMLERGDALCNDKAVFTILADALAKTENDPNGN